MKKILIFSLLLIGFTSNAQRFDRNCDFRSDLTPEQFAELKTKQMTLHLDLTEKQQNDLKKINLKNKTLFNGRGNRNNRPDPDRGNYENRMAHLDSMINYKREVKSILNEEQYKKWERNQGERRKGEKGFGRPHR